MYTAPDVLKNMENRLSEGQKRRLKSIYAPVVVAAQPSTTWCNLCVLPDGEIRHYGKLYGERVYLSSTDAGLSWSIGDVDRGDAFCSGVQLPWSGRWVTSFYTQGEGGWQNGEMPAVPAGASGWMAVLSDEGPGGNAFWRKISDLNVRCPRIPLALSQKHRVLIPANAQGNPQSPAVAWSDDDGESWKTVVLKPAPVHEVRWPHQSVRWQNGACEPTIIERSDGSLLMLARTSQDYHYQYESFDGGETWTDPVPSPIHATLTMPTMLRLTSGAVLAFFCNTQPLPEMNKEVYWPPLKEFEINGVSEDVFTNRDANHAAISMDEGKTWQGFRELHLTDIRNEPDFRTKGGSAEGLDKSVHQFQAVELPFGKVLLAFGQHSTARRMLVFDPAWLLEKGREEDLSTGLINLTTHVYYKSVSGNCRTKSGHCSWNRTSGAILVPDPSGNYEEALWIQASPDPRLFFEQTGAVWNFPASLSGCVTVRLRPGSEGLRLTLADRWFNPCDSTAPALSPYSVVLYEAQCPADEWSECRMVWTEDSCRVSLNDRPVVTLRPNVSFKTGINYLLLQSAEHASGLSGSYVKYLSMSQSAAKEP